MSWQAVKAARLHRVGSGTRKAVLYTIAEFTHDDGSGCWASVTTIAEDAEVQRKTARKAITEMVNTGVLTETVRGGRRAWAVTMDVPEPAESPGLPVPGDGSSATTPPGRLRVVSGSSATTTGSSATTNHKEPLEPPRALVAPLPEPKPRTRKIKTPAPETFDVTEPMRSWAADNGITTDLEWETGKFLDYHAGKGNMMVDWRKAWNTWMRNSKDFNRNKPTASGEDVYPWMQ